MSADIETRADVEVLVRGFYERAMADDIIGWLFVDVAELDLDAHLPVIVSFWDTVLLGGSGYRGGVFGRHAALHAKAGLRSGHFQRWLSLWRDGVDARFAGPRAELAKAHAERTAAAFERRLAGYDAPASAGGLIVTQHQAGR
ncbi:MAG: group III truncated hemoglobin [Solirubrobacteraceae bacterium]